MKRFIEGEDRRQGTLLPEYLDDYVSEENPVRVIDVFVDELDLEALGFDGVVPEATGRPGYHPGLLLKIYVYGYLNQIASSRRLEREAQRNVEMMWLTGRLAPDFKTLADFRKDNGSAIRAACRQFVTLCRKLELFTHALAAIDGSKFKAVNARDKNFTPAKLEKRKQQVEASIERYMAALETADRQDGEIAEAKAGRLKEKIAALREQMQGFQALEAQVRAAPDQQISLTDPDARAMATSGKGTGVVGYKSRRRWTPSTT
jgi:transposase